LQCLAESGTHRVQEIIDTDRIEEGGARFFGRTLPMRLKSLFLLVGLGIGFGFRRRSGNQFPRSTQRQFNTALKLRLDLIAMASELHVKLSGAHRDEAALFQPFLPNDAGHLGLHLDKRVTGVHGVA
jgi:hypothetical protein